MKYIDLSPKIAKMLLVKTIKGSLVMAKMAGTESIAKIISENSKNNKLINNGVASLFHFHK